MQTLYHNLNHQCEREREEEEKIRRLIFIIVKQDAKAETPIFIIIQPYNQ